MRTAFCEAMVAVAGRTPRRPTFSCPPDQLFRLLLALLVPGVADLERLVETHTSTEPLLPPQVLGQREVAVARHQRPAAAVPLPLELALPNILAALADLSTQPQTAAVAAVVQVAQTEMVPLAAEAALHPIPIRAAVVAVLAAALLVRTGLLELLVAMAVTTILGLVAVLAATTLAALLHAPAIPAQQAAVVAALALVQRQVLAAHITAAQAALALNGTAHTAQVVAAAALLPVALVALLAALVAFTAVAVVADLPEAGHQGLWAALALRV